MTTGVDRARGPTPPQLTFARLAPRGTKVNKRPRRRSPRESPPPSVWLGDAERTRQLRHRYLALAGLRVPADPELPGPAPTADELSGRWNPAS